MRKLVLILVASIAVITFIRAFDFSEGMNAEEPTTGEIVLKVVQ